LLRRLREHSPEEIGVSVITEAELRFGALNSSSPERNGAAAEACLQPFAVLPFTRGHIPVYARMRAELERAGMRIGALDMLITAQAVALEATIVTDNLREFRRVLGLRVENWLA
jgi:tRNA(fMet)-specific endonuclease VapC